LPVLNDVLLEEAINNEWIINANKQNIQPASIDLTLSDKIWERSYQSPLFNFNHLRRLREKNPILYKNKIYVAELNESADLPSHLFGMFSTKSSIGRLGALISVLTEEGELYNTASFGYRGKLYAEIVPLTFDIQFHQDDAITQIRLMTDDTVICCDKFDIDISEYYRSLSLCNDYVNTRQKNDPQLFFDHITNNTEPVHLFKNELCLISSVQEISLPDYVCATVGEFEPIFGEFRIHFAGFIDPGFSHSKIVLEILPTYHNIRFKNSSFFVKYHPLIEPAKKLYGQRNNHYQSQRLKLSKFF
jgi:Deoxycytidine deaminase